ncbi:unnamed protein product [Malus baccata var. baccata]
MCFHVRPFYHLRLIRDLRDSSNFKTRRRSAHIHKFFLDTYEEKRKYNKVVKKHLFGYFDNELTHNVKDWKQSFDYMVNEPITFPTSMMYEDYAKKMKKLTFRLMELIGLSLVLSTNSYLQFILYPPCPFADLALGVVGHKDTYDLVKSIPNAFIINIGNNIHVPPFKLFQNFCPNSFSILHKVEEHIGSCTMIYLVYHPSNYFKASDQLPSPYFTR